MKGKSLAVISLVLTILIATLGISPAFSATGVCPVSNFTMEPASTIWSLANASLGDTFSIDVIAHDLVDFHAWSDGVKYDPSVLNYTGFTWGNMSSYGTIYMVGQIDGVVNTTSGETTAAWAQPFISGVNIASLAALKLLTWNFEVVGYGTTTIEHFPMPLCSCSNDVGEVYKGYTDYPAYNATFTMMPPAPYGPTVTFSYPAATYYENENVTFTAESDPGYNVATGFLEVMNYTWDFGDGTGTVVDDVSGTPGADSVVTHNFTTAGTWTVNVTAQTADNPGGDPLETDSYDKTITIFAAALSYIDVYTEKMGDGPEIYGSAFEPGEEVTISAELKYMGVPVNDTWVGFQLQDKNGSDVAYRTAKTVGGIATIDVRLPLMGTPHLMDEDAMGLFVCTATANVFENPYNDTVSLYVGYIVDTIDVTASTPVSRGNQVTIDVNVTNYGLETKDVYLSIVVYDSVGVAIAVYSTSFTIMAASYNGLNVVPYSTIETAYPTIPTTAWPGTADVYVNAFDKEPLQGGDAWCPEITTTFAVT